MTYSPRYYRLQGRVAVPCKDAAEWGYFFFKTDRQVALTEIGCLQISTVFLGLDHNYFGKGDPVLFETMIFDGEDNYQERCCTWEQAEVMHAKAVEIAKEWIRNAEKISKNTIIQTS